MPLKPAPIPNDRFFFFLRFFRVLPTGLLLLASMTSSNQCVLPWPLAGAYLNNVFNWSTLRSYQWNLNHLSANQKIIKWNRYCHQEFWILLGNLNGTDCTDWRVVTFLFIINNGGYIFLLVTFKCCWVAQDVQEKQECKEKDQSWNRFQKCFFQDEIRPG